MRWGAADVRGIVGACSFVGHHSAGPFIPVGEAACVQFGCSLAVGERGPFVGAVGVPWVAGGLCLCMSKGKKRSVCQPRDESSKRFKPGRSSTSSEQERAGIAEQQTQLELRPATGVMSLQCAEVRVSPSWHDGLPVPLCPSRVKKKTR